MSLYQDVRPKNLDEIIGNDEIKSALRKIIKANPKDRPHTFIFHGLTGAGKTTLARILATEFGCSKEDIQEYDAADTRGIDTIRQIKEKSSYKPIGGEATVVILDESHQLTSTAMEGLLKLLEDTPEHFYLILCTTDLSRIIPTIKKGRTTIFQVEKLRPSEITTLLNNIIELKNWKVDKEVIDKIVDESEGIPRQALTLLEKVVDLDTKDAISLIEKSSDSQKEIIDLCRELIKASKNKQTKWDKIVGLYEKIEAEPEQIRRSILNYIAKVLLSEKDINNQLHLYELLTIFERSLFYTGKAGLVIMLYETTLN